MNNRNAADNGLTKLQAAIRGRRSREIHASRAKDAHPIVCPFYACSQRIVEAIIALGNIVESDCVYDLGCGDGSILIPIAEIVKSKCVGFEIDSVLCATARRKAKDLGLDHRIDIHTRDILEVDLSPADILTVFLTPSCLEFLSPRFKQQCKPGSKIICYKFPLPESDGWKPAATTITEDVINTKNEASRSHLYLYQL